MPTDKLLLDYSTHFPNAMAKLIHAERDDYEAKSITFKAIEKQADIFLIGRSGQRVALIETQGYKKDWLYYDMLMKVTLFCVQNDYRGSIEAAAIFLEEAHARAAQQFFEQQFGNSSLLRFTPKIFIFSRIKEDELRALDDIHLVPLYPLCAFSQAEVEQRIPQWAEQIKTASGLNLEERQQLLSFLAGAISHRVKSLTIAALNKLFGGFAMEDTPIGQELVQRGVQKGIPLGVQQGIPLGIPLGIQQVLVKQMAVRFGEVPEEVREKILATNNTERLERIATTLFTIQSLDELKDLLN